MKKLLLLFTILSLFNSCNGQSNNSYPKLIDETENYYEKYSYEDYKEKYHKEYAFYYKRTVTRDSKSQAENLTDKILPWEILKKYSPKDFFNQITNSIRIENTDDDRLSISMDYDLTKEEIKEYQQTGGILNKDDLSDLLSVEILHSDILNTQTNKKTELENNWTRFCCNLIPYDSENPIKKQSFYYKNVDNAKSLSGSITFKIELLTEYTVTEINKNDIGKTIEIGGNQKIKLIEFVDNKVHFEVMNNEKLLSEIEFINVSPTVKNISMPKYLYDFFRLNPKMKYSEFEKEYQKFLDTKEDDLEKNNVYVYTVEGKPDKFYFYSPKTKLSKDILIKVN